MRDSSSAPRAPMPSFFTGYNEDLCCPQVAIDWEGYTVVDLATDETGRFCVPPTYWGSAMTAEVVSSVALVNRLLRGELEENERWQQLMDAGAAGAEGSGSDAGGSL